MPELSDVMAAHYVDARTLELMTADAYADRLPNPRIVTSVKVRPGIDVTTVRHTAAEWQSPGSSGWAIAELASSMFDGPRLGAIIGGAFRRAVKAASS